MAAKLRTGPLPDREPGRHQAPPPVGRVPPFVLIRQLDGDVLLSPFPRDGLSAEAAILVKAVAVRLARDLPAGVFWVDAQDGRATPATIAVPQLKRRLLDNASFNVRSAA